MKTEKEILKEIGIEMTDFMSSSTYDAVLKAMSLYANQKIALPSDDILKEVEARIETPFVTAKFGDNWRAHQKRMLDEGQIDVDTLLDIAWKQGRKAILLEDLARKLMT